MCQFESHTSAMVARYQMGQLDEHQRKSKEFFSNHPEKLFEVNDRAFILSKRKTFHKTDIIHHPTYEPETFIVRKIDRKMIPWIYHLSHENSQQIVKKLYSWQMKKISSKEYTFDDKKRPEVIQNLPHTDEKNNSVFVHDVTLQNSTRLRSNKIISGKEIPFYRVEIEGRKEIFTLSGIKLLKKTYGLKYGEFFNNPVNHQYVI